MFVVHVELHKHELIAFAVLKELDRTNDSFPYKYEQEFVSGEVPIAKECIVKIKIDLCVQKLEWIRFAEIEKIKDFEKFESEFNMYRLFNDRRVSYGDGGRALLCFPVWICSKLEIDEKSRLNMVKKFTKLCDERKDYQENSVIQDIIDPDLCPYLLLENESDWVAQKKASLERYGKLSSREKRHLEDVEGIISTGGRLRAKYKWIPSRFEIDENDQVFIKSGIHNLPVILKNKALYGLIAKVFQSMLPMFRKINVLEEGPGSLQVVVKVQRYAKNEHEIAILEGSAVVFSNALPHRVKKTVNLTKKTLYKTFINFFIVDPKFRIAGTADFIPLAHFELILNTAFKKKIEKTIPKVITTIIYEFFTSYSFQEWKPLDAAKKFRSRVRQEMSQIPSGWAHWFWGNSGEMKFVDDLSTLDASIKNELCHRPLTHTQSF
jgi:hypothetical protein